MIQIQKIHQAWNLLLYRNEAEKEKLSQKEGLKEIDLKDFVSIFTEALKEAQVSYETYSNYIEKLKSGEDVSPFDVIKERYKVYHFYRCIEPVLQWKERHKWQKIASLLSPCISPEQLSFFQDPTIKKILSLQAVLDLEDAMGDNLPWHTFQEIALKKSRFKSNGVFEEFVQEMRDAKLSGDALEKGLIAMSHFLEGGIESAFEIAWWLKDELCLPMLALDSAGSIEQRVWRERVLRVGTVQVKGKTMTLKKEIVENETGLKQKRVFQLKEDANVRLVMGHHRLSLGLERKSWEREGFGVKLPDVVYQDPKGRFFLIEKLAPLNKVMSAFSKKNEAPFINLCFIELAKFLRFMFDQKRLLAPTFSSIGFNPEGLLRTTKALNEEEYSWKKMEEWCQRATHQRPSAYKALFEKADLHETDAYKRLMKVLKAAVFQTSICIEDFAMKENMDYSWLIDQGCHDIFPKMQERLQFLVGLYPGPKSEQEKLRDLQKVLYAWHEEHHAIFVDWQRFEKTLFSWWVSTIN